MSGFIQPGPAGAAGTGGVGPPGIPYSAFPRSGSNVFPDLRLGAGEHFEEGFGVGASIVSDVIWRCYWRVPVGATAASLVLVLIADAAAGAAKINPKWALINAGENPESAVLNPEGTQTVTWAAGDNNKYKFLTVALDAAAITANRIMRMDLTFEGTGWTLAVILHVMAFVDFS